MKKIYICIFLILLVFIYGNSFAFNPSSNEMYNGIDVSAWQKTINYRDVKEDGIDVVYIKSSQGNNFIDPYFERNYKEAKENNLKVGVYHFLTARTTEEARNEADFFSSVISKKQIDCKLAMDFEDFGRLSKKEINEISKVFLERVEEKTKKEMVIYSDTSNAINVFDKELADKYHIWIAQYGVKKPSNNGKWETWIGFQYADNGRIKGINALVDKNCYTSGIFLSDISEIPENKHRNNKEKIRKIKVKRGDTLSKIAIKYNTNINEIVDFNKVQNRNLIFRGEILNISFFSQEKRGETNHYQYTIRKGDTLSKIARKFNISIREIVLLNEINNINLIYAGESLRIEIK